MDRLLREREHDTYKVRGKLPDPTACPDCGVMYRDGRWTWDTPPPDAASTTCPACQRVRDGYPGGFLTLSGSFQREHREEIVGLARNIEERERSERPLKRIMAIEEQGDDLLVTTTDPNLARNIGDALESAYEGELDYTYSDEGNTLRVGWRR